MNNLVFKDCVIVIDLSYKITHVFPQDSIFAEYLNHDFLSLINTNENLINERFQPFFEDKQTVINQSLSLNLNKEVFTFQYNGIKDGSFIYLFISFQQSSEMDMMRKMMIMNSQQVNQIRELQKKIQTQDIKAFEEISKLNSDLLNSKRLIEKQNAELNRYNSLLSQMAREDSLTGCYNRRYFKEYIKEHYMVSLKDRVHCLSLIDFNDFKLVNDRLGHDAGDRLLIEFVNSTKKIISHIGEIFRIGGDEFVIIFNQTLEKEAMSYMRDISIKFGNFSSIASISFGLVSFNESELNHEFDITYLLRKADELLYEHKRVMKAKA